MTVAFGTEVTRVQSLVGGFWRWIVLYIFFKDVVLPRICAEMWFAPYRVWTKKFLHKTTAVPSIPLARRAKRKKTKTDHILSPLFTNTLRQLSG